MRTSPILQVAVVGAGIIGSWHAKVLDELEGAELACVVDMDRVAADSLATEHSSTAYYDLDTALASATAIDAVAVCVPSGLHADIAVPALQSGKHVIIEKPVDISLEATDRIIAAQRASGALATVIHQHRFDESSRIVLDAIASGHFGRLTSAVVSGAWWRGQSYYDSGAWRGTWALDGGGALMNQSIHIIDLLVAAMGCPVEVFAYTECLAHERIEVEDIGVAVVKFESGALGTIQGTTAAFPGVSSRLQVHGDRGSAVIENDELVYVHITSGERDELFIGESRASKNQVDQYVRADAAAAKTAAGDPRQLSDAHRYQYESFLRTLAGKEELAVSLDEARLSLSVVLAIYESARTGRPVAIPATATVGARS
jgi:UDP-N-acetyl-2-amino-2-deoxyglucuronate dehydrogenase